MAFTEFYANASTGSNLNSGSATGAAVYTGVGDSDGTSKFTPSDGSTPASTVSVGMFASIYVTSGATVATFIGRVTAVAAGVNGAITVSTTAISGAIPASSGSAHTITCKVGGEWLGPNGASGFPYNFIAKTCTDSGGDTVRVNFKNNATYSITAAISHTLVGPVIFQGYTTSPGDGGRAIIDGGTSGSSYVLLTLSGSGVAQTVHDSMIFQNNGASGSASLLSLGASPRAPFFRCVANNSRGTGFDVCGMMVECEAYACNKSNTSNLGGFASGTSGSFDRCFSHDNTGSNTSGFYSQLNGATFLNCIASTNGLYGLYINNPTALGIVYGCDFYNNGSDGYFHASSAASEWIENCNFVKNGRYGYNTNAVQTGFMLNCGFGSGTQVNTSGQTNGTGTSLQVVGSVTYASGVTPWNDPANGDFSITLAAAEGAGRGNFTETSASLSAPNTVGYPDIGAAQHQASSAGVSGSRIFTGF